MQKLVVACLRGGVYKAEDVVQDVPAPGFVLELEDLSVAHGLLLSVHLWLCKYLGGNDVLQWSSHLQSAGNQDDDAVLGRGLCVFGGNLVNDLVEREVLSASACEW
jgi:hypothetical protein